MANLIPSLLDKVSPMGRAMQQTAGMAQAMQSGNPMGALLSQSNPQMKQVMDYIKSTGGDPKSAFYMLAKQKGVDPEPFLQRVRGMMKG